MEITIQTPNGALQVSGSQATVAWALMNLPEGKLSGGSPKVGSALRAGKGTRKRYTSDEKASHFKAADAHGNKSEYARQNGISYATLMS